MHMLVFGQSCLGELTYSKQKIIVMKRCHRRYIYAMPNKYIRIISADDVYTRLSSVFCIKYTQHTHCQLYPSVGSERKNLNRK